MVEHRKVTEAELIQTLLYSILVCPPSIEEVSGWTPEELHEVRAWAINQVELRTWILYCGCATEMPQVMSAPEVLARYRRRAD